MTNKQALPTGCFYVALKFPGYKIILSFMYYLNVIVGGILFAPHFIGVRWIQGSKIIKF